eukprot:gnl/TRDRNA2_/TRDRNA2_135719_c0_seq1.p1 gnl/TRDRNA2_/TRDRNA2_135719_c0~~gnl/TRDRNA2_/TRDRNA2_135719_c0_seq1.p1  ORF type:complete len:312 (-),score=55.47 gnl/TRDRNA2_/TRDRNA2_135719_c0_seq1:149-1084(-)
MMRLGTLCMMLFSSAEVSGFRILKKWVFDNGTFAKYEYTCQNYHDLDPTGSPPKKVCMDGWERMQNETHMGKPCVVYDLGVREQADLSLNAMKDLGCVVYDLGVREQADLSLNAMKDLGCVVRAYDPSAVTARWYDAGEMREVQELKKFEQDGKYKLHRLAASGKDGNVTLYQYNWDQVAVFRADNATSDQQKVFTLPSVSYPTMLRDNGDSFVDIMKIDIEGSEFAFLQGMFDAGCPAVGNFLFEWHSASFDFELGSPPEVKKWEERLKQCGFKKDSVYPFYVDEHPTGEEKFTLGRHYYGHSQYCKYCY